MFCNCKKDEVMKIFLMLMVALPLFAVDHPDQLTDLTDAVEFPRFSKSTLESTGYPDHMHRFFWSGYNVEPGPGMFCQGAILKEVEGLEITETKISFAQTDIIFNPGFEPCQVIPALEFVEYALDRCEKVLNIKPVSNLHLIMPNNGQHYSEMTGYGTWRKFKLVGDNCIPMMISSVMIAHTMVDMTTQWLLHGCGEIPDWFANGLGAYIADMGPHFISYVAMYRPDGEILLTPMETDMQLYHDPLPDPGTDKKGFRIARYNAFIMVWNLVEYNGGLDALQELLAELSAGTDFNLACEKVYNMPLSGLLNKISPKKTGEPIGSNIVPVNTTKPPKEK
jgi:hypothetical protein